jgi:uncharacterized membrane protein YbjE (DUF340 family)
MSSFIVIGFFAVGIIIGRFFQNKKTIRKGVDKAVSWAVYALLFLLGISVGINEEVVSHFHHIGIKAIGIAVGATGGSVIFAGLLYHFYFKQKPKKQ